MKIEVENPVINQYELKNDADFQEALFQFNELIRVIKKSKNRYDLLKNLDSLNLSEIDTYFKYGFGGSHFWVKQKIKEDLTDRIIFVRFDD